MFHILFFIFHFYSFIFCLHWRVNIYFSESGKPPKFTEPLQPVTAVEGSKLTLRCVVTGSPVLDIKWYREGRELRPTRDFKPSYDIQTGEATLTIPEVFPDDQGTFTCTAINKYGKDATTAMLTVKGTPYKNIFIYFNLKKEYSNRHGRQISHQNACSLRLLIR